MFLIGFLTRVSLSSISQKHYSSQILVLGPVSGLVSRKIAWTQGYKYMVVGGKRLNRQEAKRKGEKRNKITSVVGKLPMRGERKITDNCSFKQDVQLLESLLCRVKGRSLIIPVPSKVVVCGLSSQK